MDRLTRFKNEIKVGDLVTVLSTQKYFPLRRNNGKWFLPPNPKPRPIKKGEAMIVVIDKTTPVNVEDNDVDDVDDSALTTHEVIVFASGSACFFGLPRANLCRY